MKFKDYLDKQTYDKYYQDIELIKFEGYAKSCKSWDNIKDLVDWQDKTVIDIGCFHGYFCFKAEKAGAKSVIGLDLNEDALKTTMILAHEYKSNVNFLNIPADGSFLSADIILCLNVFHHIKNQDKFIDNINAKYVIFEIDKEDLPKIEKRFKILVKKDSHRASSYTGDTPNRLILLATIENNT